jgi:hypothetical protein
MANRVEGEERFAFEAQLFLRVITRMRRKPKRLSMRKVGCTVAMWVFGPWRDS